MSESSLSRQTRTTSSAPITQTEFKSQKSKFKIRFVVLSEVRMLDSSILASFETTKKSQIYADLHAELRRAQRTAIIHLIIFNFKF